MLEVHLSLCSNISNIVISHVKVFGSTMIFGIFSICKVVMLYNRLLRLHSHEA